MIAFLKQSQASSFSIYDESMAESWKKIEIREFPSTSNRATESQHDAVCAISIPRPASSSGLVPFGQGFGLNVTVSFGQHKPQRCYSNQTYTVLEGDTCKSISEKMSVDTGTLEILNNLYADCSNTVVGTEL